MMRRQAILKMRVLLIKSLTLAMQRLIEIGRVIESFTAWNLSAELASPWFGFWWRALVAT
jgi:hypothetical protein